MPIPSVAGRAFEVFRILHRRRLDGFLTKETRQGAAGAQERHGELDGEGQPPLGRCQT